MTLERLGIPCEFHHHEVATGGQCEIDMRFATLTRMADQVMTYKYVVKNVARRARQDGDVHAEAALRRQRLGDALPPVALEGRRDADGRRRRATPGSRRPRAHYVGGILAHAPALLAFCAPTTNSYRRLVPGYEAPVNLVYSQRNRSACIRIPMYSQSPKAKRIEFRCPDPTANPYLAFSAMLMAGLDGIERKLDPGAPVRLRPVRGEPRRRSPQVPGSLAESLDALEADHDFLTKGGVFSEELISTWIDWKRRTRPTSSGCGPTRPSSSSTSTPRAADRAAALPRAAGADLRPRQRAGVGAAD